MPPVLNLLPAGSPLPVGNAARDPPEERMRLGVPDPLPLPEDVR